VAVFISKSQSDQAINHIITMDCGFRWKWKSYSATVIHHLTDKFCYLPLRYGHA